MMRVVMARTQFQLNCLLHLFSVFGNWPLTRLYFRLDRHTEKRVATLSPFFDKQVSNCCLFKAIYTNCKTRRCSSLQNLKVQTLLLILEFLYLSCAYGMDHYLLWNQYVYYFNFLGKFPHFFRAKRLTRYAMARYYCSFWHYLRSRGIYVWSKFDFRALFSSFSDMISPLPLTRNT